MDSDLVHRVGIFICTGAVHKPSFYIFSLKNEKGFSDGLSYSTPQKSKETVGNAITQPYPIPFNNVEFSIL